MPGVDAGAGGAAAGVERPAEVVGVGGVAQGRRAVLALPAQRLLERVPAEEQEVSLPRSVSSIVSK